MVIENVAKHLPANGSAYITNNIKYHNALKVRPDIQEKLQN